MTYRDEEDALRARNDALESELAQERRERVQLEAEHKRQLLQARGIVPPEPAVTAPRRTALFLFVGLASVLCVAGGMAYSLFRPVARTPPATPFVTHAAWHAKVASATGIPLAPGTDCRLESTLTYPTATSDARYATAKVTCGATVIYDSQDRSEQSATTLQFQDHRRDVAGLPPKRIVDLEYDEEGPRTRAKPSAAINTARGLAVFTRELPALRVELTITPGSDPADVRPQ